jgi:pimeloyl-ACP methyl ester carboxylesterase
MAVEVNGPQSGAHGDNVGVAASTIVASPDAPIGVASAADSGDQPTRRSWRPSVSALFENSPPGGTAPPILPPQDGFLFLDRAKFRAAFAADVSLETAAFMADSQAPWGLEALGGAVTEPAWKTKPSWYLVATEDGMIPPDAQRAMSRRAGSSVVEVKASHAVYVSQPRSVADLISKAAAGTALAAR